MGFDTDSADFFGWCRRHLGAAPAAVLFESGHLSRVIGTRLADGREVVVKIRPAAARLAACVRVQGHLAGRGFPCPRPLAGPAPFGPATAAVAATAEEYLPGGGRLVPWSDAPDRFAEVFAELVALAPPASALPTLSPAPPWVGWDHDRPGCWPVPDDLDTDLNAHPGPAWLDRLAVRVRARLAELVGSGCRPVVGHSDFEAQNTRWAGRSCRAVHDWDSVAARPEPILVGAAAAVFTATGAPLTEATVDQTGQFLAAYGVGRGRPLGRDEKRACWAAGLWVRAFNAKKAWLRAGPDGAAVLDRLVGEAAERWHRAGG
ncbi:MAG TPA: phosphotransferase [Mycobacteriales bacterium]|nr:phosphotransferase [Mycobacteriales bacterium]